MSKRSYRLYLQNPKISIPRTTLYRMNKRSKCCTQNVITNQPANNIMKENINRVERDATNNNEETYLIQNDSAKIPDVGDEIRNEFLLNTTDDREEVDDEIENDDELSLEHEEIVNTLIKSVSSQQELVAALLTVFFNGKITQYAFRLVVRVVNIVSPIKVPITFVAMKNCLTQHTDTVELHKIWYCEKCFKTFKELDNRFQRMCNDCKSRLSTYYHTPIEPQLRRIFQNNSYLHAYKRKTNNSDVLRDVYDGRIYQNLLTSEDKKWFLNNQAFSLMLNTDGIAVSNKSKLTIWPVYLVLNELPIEKRYCIDNIVVAGVAVGECKPNFNIFLTKLVAELKSLEYGIMVRCNNEVKSVKFFVISAVYDKPARASVLNLVSCNGFTSCLKCLQDGESIKTKDGGSTRVFPFKAVDPCGPLRTNDSYNIDVKFAEDTKEPSRGIKGRTPLSHLKYYNPITNTCIDYMHSILEGVIKGLFKYWFQSEFHDKNFSLRKFMKEIDNRLLSIRPPTFVTTAPRSIYIWCEWRAHEFLSFIIFYALPCFYGIINYDLYNNLVKLVIFLEVILGSEIKKKELDLAHLIILEFTRDLETLYCKNIMLSGVHELVHLVQCTYEFGPLNSVNCFQFEELNRKFMSFIHGKDLMVEEFIKVFSTAQCLSAYQNYYIANKELSDFIRENPCFQTSNRKRIYSDIQSYKILDIIQDLNDKHIVQKICSYFNRNQEGFSLRVFKRLNYKGILYTSSDETAKHSDSCFLTKKGEYGLIKWFTEINDEIFLISYKILQLHNMFFSPNHPTIKSNLTMCHITKSFFVVNIKEIEKAVLINLTSNETFVSKFRSSHLFT